MSRASGSKTHIASLVLLLLLALLGCSKQASSLAPPYQPAAAGGTIPSPTAGLPPLPGPGGPASQELPRSASHDQFEFIRGNEIFSSSAENVFLPESIVLLSNAAPFGWAMYSVNTGGYQPTRIEFDLGFGANAAAFIGVSNYGEQRWELSGPFTGSGSIQLGPGDYLSGAGDSPDRRFYFIALVQRGSGVQLNHAVVHFDNGIANGTTVSGELYDEAGLPIAGMQLQIQPLGRFVETDAQGRYVFYNVPDGSHDISPDDFSGAYDYFDPALRSIEVAGEDWSMQDFTGYRYDIRGQVSADGRLLSGVELLLNPGGVTSTTGADGRYEFRKLVPGDYTVTILSGGLDFAPPQHNVSIVAADADGYNFLVNSLEPFYAISGYVRDGGLGVEGAVLSLQPGNRKSFSDSDGYYRFDGLAPGTYNLHASASGYRLTPAYFIANVVDADVQADIDAEPVQLYEFLRECYEKDLSGTTLGAIPGAEMYVASSLTNEVLAIRSTDQFGQASAMLPPGDYYSYFRHPLFNGVSSFGGVSFSITSSDLVLNEKFERTNTVTWQNFVSSYISSECIQCHRPDAALSADPPLRTYSEVSSFVNNCNTRIQNGTMPPGNPSHDSYMRWFTAWRDAGTPLE